MRQPLVIKQSINWLYNCQISLIYFNIISSFPWSFSLLTQLTLRLFLWNWILSGMMFLCLISLEMNIRSNGGTFTATCVVLITWSNESLMGNNFKNRNYMRSKNANECGTNFIQLFKIFAFLINSIVNLKLTSRCNHPLFMGHIS